MKQVGQKEIAKLAGVDISTVSRALSNEQGISVEMRSKILMIADELGYVIRSKMKAEKHIGVIVPELISLYYAELVHVLGKEIRKKGYNMLVSISDFSADNIVGTMISMQHTDVSGIVCCTMNGDESRVLEEAKKIKKPIVLLSDGTDVEYIDCDCIFLNQRSGVSQILRHLVDLGHTKIGFVGESYSASRLACFEKLIEEMGLFLNPRMVKMGTNRFELGGYEQMKLLLAEEERPTAVVASYDQVAIGALKAIDEAGLEVPDDISVVGFDNIVTDKFLPKKLTTVTNPIGAMGEIALRLLFNKFGDKEKIIQNVSLQPRLIIRETTKVL